MDINKIRKIIRATTVIAVVLILGIIGWTGFFMAQSLDIIPSLSTESAAVADETKIESVNSALLDSVKTELDNKTARPEPSRSELINPFIIVPEPQPQPLPPVEPPETSPPPAETEQPATGQ